MKLLLIEGSPKLRRSASSILLDGLRDHLEDVEIDTCAVKSAADSGHAAAALTAADAVVLFPTVCGWHSVPFSAFPDGNGERAPGSGAQTADIRPDELRLL